MSRTSKLLDGMRRNPAGDWSMDDVMAVCRRRGVACAPPSRGSHYRISHPAASAILTIPARRPLKPVYIRLFVDYIDQVEAAANDD